MEIAHIAYARAWCANGFRYFVTRGPLTWFLLLYLCATAFAVLKGTAPSPVRILINLSIAIVCGLVVGIAVFPIMKWQSHKWDRTLTDSDRRKVQEILTDLHPFRQIDLFIVGLTVFGFLLRWLFGLVH